jgi:hypothetical protein
MRVKDSEVFIAVLLKHLKTNASPELIVKRALEETEHIMRCLAEQQGPEYPFQ